MAQGSIIWRCRICGNNRSTGACKHPRAGYAIVYRIGVRQKWETVGRNKKDAERRLANILHQLHSGAYRQITAISFDEFADKWLQDYAAGSVKPLTLRRYRSIVSCYLKSAFAGFLLADISTEHVQGFLSRALRERRVAPRTVNQALAVLKVMLKHAKRWHYLRENPSEGVKPLRVEPKEMDYLKPNEVRLLLQQADEPYRTLFLTAILTGMRLGELLGLQWGDIDWTANLIHVRRSLYWCDGDELAEAPQKDVDAVSWRFSTPKSRRSIRAIVMSPRLREALEFHRINGPESPQGLVFCTRQGTPMDRPNMVRREFWPTLARARLRRVRFHDLRHTYTSLLIAQGAHVKFIQSQLGHSSVQTTIDRYGHLLPEMQHSAGERLDALVFSSTEAVKEEKELTVV